MINNCSATQIFCDWIIPEGIVHRQLGDFYEKNPVMSRVIATPIALISGFVKTFLFPVICLVGVVVMPIVALIRHFKGEKDACEWLKAWCFCILGVAASLAFIALASYTMPLIATLALLITAISVSLILHINKLIKEPDEPYQLLI